MLKIISGGNIVYADELELQNGATTKTFSVAISRDMIPISRLLAYYIRSDGEVVADSISFFVDSSAATDVRFWATPLHPLFNSSILPAPSPFYRKNILARISRSSASACLAVSSVA